MTLSTILDSFFAVNKELKVIPPYSLSSQDFDRISQLSTNLRSLVLQNCSWLTDEILKPVLKNNPKLEVLDIADCVNCTSAILQARKDLILPRTELIFPSPGSDRQLPQHLLAHTERLHLGWPQRTRLFFQSSKQSKKSWRYRSRFSRLKNRFEIFSNHF